MNKHAGPLHIAHAARLAICAAMLGAAAPLAVAAQLTAAAGAIGGAGSGDIAAGCTTYGPPSLFGDFFGSGQGISVPAGGIGACGYVGQVVENHATSGTANASHSVGPVILGNPGYAGSYSGGSSALASYTGLHVQAAGGFSGGLPGSPTALFDASSAALFTDKLTLSSPLVAPASAGFVAYRFQIDGSLESLGTPAPYYFGEARANLAFRHESGPIYGAGTWSVRRGEVGSAWIGQPIPGWTGSVGGLSGGGTISTLDYLGTFPIVFGQPWDFTLGLAARAYGESATDFWSTARLVGVDVFDASGRPVTQFELTSESGTNYMVVPEPEAPALFALGLAALTWLLRASAKKKPPLPAEPA